MTPSRNSTLKGHFHSIRASCQYYRVSYIEILLLHNFVMILYVEQWNIVTILILKYAWRISTFTCWQHTDWWLENERTKNGAARKTHRTMQPNGRTKQCNSFNFFIYPSARVRWAQEQFFLVQMRLYVRRAKTARCTTHKAHRITRPNGRTKLCISFHK